MVPLVSFEFFLLFWFAFVHFAEVQLADRFLLYMLRLNFLLFFGLLEGPHDALPKGHPCGRPSVGGSGFIVGACAVGLIGGGLFFGAVGHATAIVAKTAVIRRRPNHVCHSVLDLLCFCPLVGQELVIGEKRHECSRLFADCIGGRILDSPRSMPSAMSV